jgi:NTP pyrophosphatase (non-canonical NTP hydrolase)
LADELGDILYWVLLISHDWDIDLVKSYKKKLQQNKQKYPVKKAKGKHTKYNKL